MIGWITSWRIRQRERIDSSKRTVNHMHKLASLLFLFASSLSVVHARCAPFENGPNWTAEVEVVSVTDQVGPYMIWTCWPDVFTPQRQSPTRHCIEASWVELGTSPLGNLGSRAETIRRASDPIAAFHASYARHATRASPRCDALLKGL